MSDAKKVEVKERGGYWSLWFDGERIGTTSSKWRADKWREMAETVNAARVAL